MALKGNRKYDEGTEILYRMNEVSEAGIVVVAASSGTGLPGDSANLVKVPTAASGQFPIGLLLTDVVSIDLSRYTHTARFHRDEVPVGSPVTLLRDGWVVTDRIQDAVSPVPGQTAYFDSSGWLTTVDAGGYAVGTFVGQKTSDGYVRVDINIGS